MATLSFAHRPHRRLLDAGDRPRGPYSKEPNFDTNMVIILVALLCALICAVGLNSIVRCFLRCSRRFSLEAGERNSARMANTGLKKSTLRRIPVTVFRSGLGSIPAAAAASVIDCPICLGDFEDGEKVRVLPRCRHTFHVGCIDTWLVAHSSCPTCRQSILEAPPSAVSDAVGYPAMEFMAAADDAGEMG